VQTWPQELEQAAVVLVEFLTIQAELSQQALIL
jgi:hypothetical protein